MPEISDDVAEIGNLISKAESAWSKDKFKEAQLFSSEACALAEKVGDQSWSAAALCASAESYLALEQYDESLQSANKALELSRRRRDPAREAASLCLVSKINFVTIGPVEAVNPAKRAVSLVRSLGMTIGEVATVLSAARSNVNKPIDQGMLSKVEDKWDLATMNFQASLHQHQKVGDGKLSTALDAFLKVCGDLGYVWGATTGLLSVPDLHCTTAETKQELKNPKGKEEEAASLYITSLNHLLSDKLDPASQEAEKARDKFQDLRHQRGVAACLGVLAQAKLAMHDVGEAVQLSREAVNIFLRLGLRKEAASGLVTFAQAHLCIDKSNVAFLGIREAVVLSQSLGDVLGQINALRAAMQVHLHKKEASVALQRMEEALALIRGTGDQKFEASALQEKALVCAARGKFTESLQAAQEALTLAKTLSDQCLELTALHTIAKVRLAKKDVSQTESEKTFASAVDLLSSFGGLGKRKEQQEVLNTLYKYRMDRDEYSEALTLLGDGKQLAGSDKRWLADIACMTATVYLKKSMLQEAIQSAEEALAEFRHVGHRHGQITALKVVVEAQIQKQDTNAALKTASECVALYKKWGDLRGEASALGALADVYLKRGEPMDAIAEAQEALVICEKLGDRSGYASIMMSIVVNAHMMMAEYDEATRTAHEAVSILREAGDKPGIVRVLTSLSSFCLQAGDTGEALSSAREVASIASQAGDVYGEASAQHTVARIYIARGDFREATAAYSEALAGYQRIDDKLGEASVLETIMRARLEDSNAGEALRAAERVIGIYRELGLQKRLAAFQHVMVFVHMSQGKFKAALASASESQTLYNAMDDQAAQARVVHTMADVLLERTRAAKHGQKKGRSLKVMEDWPAEALAKAKAALRIYRRLENKRGEVTALQTISKAHMEKQNVMQASQAARDALAISEELGWRQGVAWSFLLDALAQLCIDGDVRISSESLLGVRTTGSVDDAERLAMEAHVIFRVAGDLAGEESALEVLNELRERRTPISAIQDKPRQRASYDKGPNRKGPGLLWRLQSLQLDALPANQLRSCSSASESCLALADGDKWSWRFQQYRSAEVESIYRSCHDAYDSQLSWLESASIAREWWSDLLNGYKDSELALCE